MVPDTLGCMSVEHQVQVPARYARVNAWVISRDTDTEVRFLTEVFGAVETPGSRILDPDGDIGHVEVEIGDSVIMLFDAKPGWPPTPAHLRVYVSDVVVAVEQAVAAGARAVTQPTMLAFGERVARVRDPQGHLWWLHEQRGGHRARGAGESLCRPGRPGGHGLRPAHPARRTGCPVGILIRQANSTIAPGRNLSASNLMSHRCLAGFVADVRSRSDRLASDIDPLIAERVIRAVFGSGSIGDLSDAAVAGAQIVLLGALAADEHFDDAGLDAFLASSRKLADQLMG